MLILLICHIILSILSCGLCYYNTVILDQEDMTLFAVLVQFGASLFPIVNIAVILFATNYILTRNDIDILKIVIFKAKHDNANDSN